MKTVVSESRASAKYAKNVFESLYNKKDIRMACARLLADSISMAHRVSSSCWSVTLFSDKIRLNVGPVEVLVLSSDYVFFLIADSDNKYLDKSKYRDYVTESEIHYSSIPIDQRRCYVPPETIEEFYPLIHENHSMLIQIAASKRPNTTWKYSFSSGVILYLNALLKLSLPMPAYFPDSVEDAILFQETDNYVQYHNTDTIGKLLEGRGNDFGISTSKPVSKLIGSRIWLISGTGKPRKYHLCYYFFADTIEPLGRDSDFKFSVTGQEGRSFEPAILISNLSWFKDFLKRQQNFSMGLRKIEKRFVDELEKVVDGQEVPYLNILQEIDQFKDSYEALQETTREAVIQSRIGQGQFRTSLIEYWQGCSVTGSQQVELLRASHIKPWRDSSNAERLDMYNGLLLLPNLDACFDSGLISFDDKGKIVISSELDKSTLLQLGIDSNLKLLRVERRHKDYLRYHRENRFRP